jgi:riboflavin kinase / FMN adenylyltransferase
MKIIYNLEDINENIAVTIGNFDGVHLGHQAILKSMLAEVSHDSLKLCVLTFRPHPQKILNPTVQQFLINNYDVRSERLAALGIDYLYEIPFDRDFSTLTPDEFVSKFLLNNSKIKRFYVGYDFAFGANKKGDIELLKNITKNKIEIIEQNRFSSGTDVVSSTLVRSRILKGDIVNANKNLGRNYQLNGIVVKGAGRGRQIGFPTANIQVEADLIIPPSGVYITQVNYLGVTYNSVTNIGNNPTFKNEESLNIETNIFDFDQDIYGESMEVIFFEKIREEKKFKGVDLLIEQISKDVQLAKTYHEK